jgi:hypothetical protein
MKENKSKTGKRMGKIFSVNGLFLFIINIALLLFTTLLLFSFINKSTDNFNIEIDTLRKKNFKLEISLEKNEFVEGEKIVVKVDIKNLSPYRDSLYRINFAETDRYFNIYTDAKDAKIFYSMAQIEYNKEPVTVFEPKETITRYTTIDNLIYYNNNTDTFGPFYAKAGKYTVSYSTPIRGKEGGETYFIYSNSINFIVKEIPENEREIFELLKELGTAKKRNRDSLKVLVDKADSILYNSELTPVVETLASNALMHKNIFGYIVDDELLNVIKLFFEKKPDSFTTFQFFRFYNMRQKNRNIDYKKDEEYFLNKYPESKALQYFKNERKNEGNGL